jgi:hypothetical protein
MKTVTVTLSFPVPEREPKVFYGDFESTIDFWESNPDEDTIAKEVKDLFEDEHRGLAEYKSVTVEKVSIS